MFRPFLLFCVILAFLSCRKKNKDAAEPVNPGKEYYPATTGKFVVYDVDSTWYNELTFQPTTLKYRIKERFSEVFTDNENKPAIRIERFIKYYNPNKSYDSIPYTIKDVWQANVTDRNVEVVEENIRFVKLIFPLQEGKSWNGNVRNTNTERNYKIEYLDRAETINGVSLEKTLAVKQIDFRTLISYQYASEKYAKGIGLVYREIKDIYSNTVVAGVPVENRIEKGVIYIQKIVSYGQE
ncbi:MAG: hypothetical protein QM534_09735 [Sediminibacterium sp.]|nr:hypothetical protein [Sediminibacterium sp.]